MNKTEESVMQLMPLVRETSSRAQGLLELLVPPQDGQSEVREAVFAAPLDRLNNCLGELATTNDMLARLTVELEKLLDKI